MTDDLAARLRACDIGICDEAADEIDRLRRWKEEAFQVLGDWELVWMAAGSPGPLGGSKAANVRTAITVLHVDNDWLRSMLDRLQAQAEDYKATIIGLTATVENLLAVIERDRPVIEAAEEHADTMVGLRGDPRIHQAVRARRAALDAESAPDEVNEYDALDFDELGYLDGRALDDDEAGS